MSDSAVNRRMPCLEAKHAQPRVIPRSRAHTHRTCVREYSEVTETIAVTSVHGPHRDTLRDTWRQKTHDLSEIPRGDFLYANHIQKFRNRRPLRHVYETPNLRETLWHNVHNIRKHCWFSACKERYVRKKIAHVAESLAIT